jgi:transposase-like protein
MFMELSVPEQRYQAVLAVLSDGRSVSEVAGQWARQSLHAWFRRYEDFGLGGLEPRSRRPVSCPHQMSGSIEAPGVPRLLSNTECPELVHWGELERPGVRT